MSIIIPMRPNDQVSSSDFQVIKFNGHFFSVSNFNQLHSDSLNFIEKELSQNNAGKTVIFSHHVPSIPIKLPSKAVEIIARYANTQPERKESDFVFPLLENEADYSDPEVIFKTISSNTAYANKNLKEIAKKAGISKNISFHSSRHTWATRALKKGMRIEYVSKLMGHGSLKTTMIYTKIVNSELDNAMDVFND